MRNREIDLRNREIDYKRLIESMLQSSEDGSMAILKKALNVQGFKFDGTKIIDINDSIKFEPKFDVDDRIYDKNTHTIHIIQDIVYENNDFYYILDNGKRIYDIDQHNFERLVSDYKIEEGKHYLCIEDCLINDYGAYENHVYYTKGVVYTSHNENCITDNYKNTAHECKDIKKFFIPVEENESVMTENKTDTLDKLNTDTLDKLLEKIDVGEMTNKFTESRKSWLIDGEYSLKDTIIAYYMNGITDCIKKIYEIKDNMR